MNKVLYVLIFKLFQKIKSYYTPSGKLYFKDTGESDDDDSDDFVALKNRPTRPAATRLRSDSEDSSDSK